MEVCISHCDGVPDDAIVSVRLGATRRQAPLDRATMMAFKFPTSLEAVSEPLQIDVLQRICSTPLVLNPKRSNYQVNLGTEGMAMGLSVQASANGDADKQQEPVGSGGKGPESSATNARDYLESHGLLRYVQTMLNALIQSRPTDPYAFMKQQLMAGVVELDRPPAQEKFSSQPWMRPAGYVHTKARSRHPDLIDRLDVDDQRVPWMVPWPDYNPPTFSHQMLDTAVWADPGDPGKMRDELQSRKSFEGSIQLEPETGCPINPVGRTGLRLRGVLGKWGPNHAADPIVTRLEPTTQRLQVVVIKRKDTGAWALPGGMVDAGEVVSATVKREFAEEAGNFEGDEQRASEFIRLSNKLFASGQVVYRGYVDDPRNTDNAWMETTAFHFHCDPELGAMLPLSAGDDAAQVKWLTVDRDHADYKNLYASHRDWVDSVALRFQFPEAPVSATAACAPKVAGGA